MKDTFKQGFFAFFCLAAAAGRAADMPAEAALSNRPPRYVFLMIADGGGFNHFRAASSFLTGRAEGLIGDTFPVRLAASTFSQDGHGYDSRQAATNPAYVKQHPTDSAAAATAMATGVKVPNGALGVDSQRRPLPNLVEAARQAGRSAGLVTTVPLSHATPAGFSAHEQDRGAYAAIAIQMIEQSTLDVLMGGGHPLFDADGKSRIIPRGWDFTGGKGEWEKIGRGEAGGDRDGDGKPDRWTLVSDRAAFVALSTGSPPARVLGVAPVYQTLQQDRAPSRDWTGDGKIDMADAAAAPAFGDPFTAAVPTLPEMVLGALNVLDDNPRGFFLMIEGGAVDWASHNRQSGRMIEEMADFEAAIRTVCEWVEAHGGWDDALLVITADHETGYLQGTDEGAAAAPFYKPVTVREKGRMPGMTWPQGGHTNQLVPLYAKGRTAERLLAKVRNTDPLWGPYVDNTDIARILFEALRAP